MLNLKKLKNDPSALDKEIDRLLKTLSVMDPYDEEYPNVADQLVKLYKLKEVDSKSRVSKDVWIGAGVNLVGILTIVSYEHAHALTSKALGFVMKSFR
jgi:hypothetical protein